MQIVVPLDEKNGIPLYRQVAEGIHGLISNGKLIPGSRLPSTRELAETLGISRFTTSKAYDELIRQGLIETSPAAGTFVSRTLKVSPTTSASTPHKVLPDAGQVRLSTYGVRILTSPDIEPADVELHPELNYGAPAPEQLPVSKWQEMVVRASRARELNKPSYTGDVFGHNALREALAGYLLRTRGVNCTPEQIAIFSGAQAALDLLSRVIINEGDQAVVENPGFPGARRTFTSYGAKIIPIPVDEDGLLVDKLPTEAEGAKLVYVTASHHDPTGVVLSVSRRHALLKWAQRTDAVIIEDDFDSEYRYGEKPVPALQGMDTTDRVVYLSAFWKIMFPVLRLGFVVLPQRLIPVMRRAKGLAERDFHYVEHEALTHFINEGHLERHIRRTRTIYSRRRQVLITKLNRELASKAKISPVSAGTHLLVRFPADIPEQLILKCAEESRVPLVSTGAYYVGPAANNEFLVPFAHVPEDQIASGVERLAQALQK